MLDLDYRNVRVGDISVGDLLAFDGFMAKLSPREQEIVNRKIAHEVADGEPATRLSTLNSDLEEAQDDLKRAQEEVTALENDKADLERRIDGLRGDLEGAERELATLHETHRDTVIRHERELQEAEARGYRRGREEANAA